MLITYLMSSMGEVHSSNVHAFLHHFLQHWHISCGWTWTNIKQVIKMYYIIKYKLFTSKFFVLIFFNNQKKKNLKEKKERKTRKTLKFTNLFIIPKTWHLDAFLLIHG